MQVCRNYIERPKLGSFCHGTTVLTAYLVSTVFGPRTPMVTWSTWDGWKLGDAYSLQTVCYVSTVSDSCSCEGGRSLELQPTCYAYNVMPVVYIHVVWCCLVVLRPWVLALAGICVRRSLQSFGEASRLPRMLVACRSVPVRPFLVSISRNVGVMRSISVVALHLVSFSSHLIHLHVRSVWSHAASLFPYFGGCVCASRGVLQNACDWPSV